MTDTELKAAETAKVFTDVKATINELGADGPKAVSRVKAHIVWLVGVVCLVSGLVLGYLLHK